MVLLTLLCDIDIVQSIVEFGLIEGQFTCGNAEYKN